jgi:hypothetical protein
MTEGPIKKVEQEDANETHTTIKVSTFQGSKTVEIAKVRP